MIKRFEKDVVALGEVSIKPHVGRSIFRIYSTKEFTVSLYATESTHSDRELIFTFPSIGKEVVIELERFVDGAGVVSGIKFGSSSHASTGERGFTVDDFKKIDLIPNEASTIVVYED